MNPLDSSAAVLTIEEAAKLLRIGRSAAYELARRYLATDGREGLPVLRLGRSLRVPRQQLMKLINGEPDWIEKGLDS